jgi:hypothetical protein
MYFVLKFFWLNDCIVHGCLPTVWLVG